MSVKVMSAIFERYPNGGGEMLLALALGDHARDDGTKVFPSVRALAEKTRQSPRTVQYQLRKMQDYGWLILERKSSGRPGDTNEYKINSLWLTGAKDDGCNFCTGANDGMDGCNGAYGRVQNKAKTGAIAVAPKPYPNRHMNRKEPSSLPDDDEAWLRRQAAKQEAFTNDRIRFAMSKDWKPDLKIINESLGYSAANINGKPITADMLTDEILSAFRKSAFDSQEMYNNNKWNGKLASYLVRCLNNPMPISQTTKQPRKQEPVSEGPGWMALQPLRTRGIGPDSKRADISIIPADRGGLK